MSLSILTQSECCCEHHMEAKHSWVHSCRSTLPLAEAACPRALPQLGCLQPTQRRYVTSRVGTSLDQSSPPCFRALALNSGLSNTTATPALGRSPSDHWSSAAPPVLLSVSPAHSGTVPCWGAPRCLFHSSPFKVSYMPACFLTFSNGSLTLPEDTGGTGV